MAESKNYIVQPQEGGNILISEDVIASIASLAVREVEGVYGLSATQTLDLTAILSKKNLGSGIRVTLQDNVIDIAYNLVNPGPARDDRCQERAGGHRQRRGVHGRRAARLTSMSTSAALPRRRRSRPEAMPLCSPPPQSGSPSLSLYIPRRHDMTRSNAREVAVHLICEIDYTGESPAQAIETRIRPAAITAAFCGERRLCRAPPAKKQIDCIPHLRDGCLRARRGAGRPDRPVCRALESAPDLPPDEGGDAACHL